MFISKTPFRISLAGGSSDIKHFYNVNGYGRVVSFTIDKFMYIMMHKLYLDNLDKIRLKYSETEDVSNVKDIKHPIIRECLFEICPDIPTGIEIASISDVPGGTGLGSSSSFTVGLVNILFRYCGIEPTNYDLASTAYKIETARVREPCGKQDHFAAAFGGLNCYTFNSDGAVDVEPIACSDAFIDELMSRLVLFYLGSARKSSEILGEFRKTIKDKFKIEAVRTLVGYAEKLKKDLENEDLTDFGRILHDGWMIKKEISSKISSSVIDKYYDMAISAGASGGRILGAGGGGFLLIYCEAKDRISSVTKAVGLPTIDFNYYANGSSVVEI